MADAGPGEGAGAGEDADALVGVPASAPQRPAARAALGAIHWRRLRQLWRSAGWPCHDMVEVELLAAGLLERCVAPGGHERLRVTDAGVQQLAATLQRHRHARTAHEALVEQVAAQMQRAGRIVWRGLSLRAPLAQPDGSTTWAMAMPDVYSIRHTTREDWVQPVVHEIKVSRADLLGDLRRPHKRGAYLAMAAQAWYVLKDGIAEPDEVPAECGVMVARDAGRGALDIVRAAPQRAFTPPLAAWMAMARATALPPLGDDAQAWL